MTTPPLRTGLGRCPLCQQIGTLHEGIWPGGERPWWHAVETEHGTAYHGPFTIPETIVDLLVARYRRKKGKG